MEVVKLLVVVVSVICVHGALLQDDEDFGDDSPFQTPPNGKPVTQALTKHKSYYTTLVRVFEKVKKTYATFDLKLSLASSNFWIVRSDCKKSLDGNYCVANQTTNGLNVSNIPVPTKNATVYFKNGVFGLFAGPALVELESNHTASNTTNTGDFGAISLFNGKFNFTEIGQFGLGFPDKSLNKTSLIDALKNNYELPELSVTISLKSRKTKSNDSITFGGVDPSCDSQNPIATFDIADKHNPKWAFNIASASTASNIQEVKAIKDANTLAILDLDLSYILAPECVFNQLNKRFQIGEKFDCDNEQNPFTLNFQVGASSFQMESKSLLIKASSSGECKYALKQGKQDGKTWIFGAPFYRTFCVKHNYGDKTISLYKKTP